MKKKSFILLLLLLVIGFASVSTSLILNGTIGIGANEDDFDVIFTDATLDGEETSNVVISENKKKITFSSNKLTNVKDKSRLDYKVKNNSTQYGANVTVSCNTTGNEYVSITGEFANETLPIETPILMEAQEVKSGYINAEMIKSYAGEDTSISITCEINGSATSRETSSYTINFDSQGGSKVEEIVVTKNDVYGELPVPEKEGYVFKGWYNEKGEKINANSIVNINQNSTIHAEWDVTLIQFVKELSANDTTNLAFDGTTDNNLRYIGSNPNNYVSFNGELWRIIGLMNNIVDSSGNKDSHIKLIRSSSIGNLAWSSGNVNNWNTSSLQILLNSGAYYTRSGAYSSIGLTPEAKNLISNIVWNLGGHNTSTVTSYSMYLQERANHVYSGNPTTWKGYVGLMYPSDFGFAVGESVRNSCLAKYMSEYSSGCYQNDWLHISNTYQWMLSSNYNNSSDVFNIYNDGRLNDKNSSRTYGISPVVYLNSDVVKVSGNGSSDNPFIIE